MSEAVERLAYTVEECCQALRLSRAKLYDLWKQGTGPKFVHVGHKRLITRAATIDAFLQSLETPPSATA
jgi:excisionase family DNA binding protein